MTVPSHGPDREYEVSPLELFFDLVFAVTRLSHHLLEHPSWRGVAETLVMLLAVFSAWYYTSWEATVLRVDRSRTLGMVVAVMVLGLFMNASVTGAFAAPLLLIQLGRTSWTLVNAPNAVWREHYSRALPWLAAVSPFWIVGAAAGPEARLPWWALAAGIDLIGTWLAHPVPGRRLRSENAGVEESAHMLQRCRLFLIIALGETVLTTGAAIAAAPRRR